jgi:hypothetical protein
MRITIIRLIVKLRLVSSRHSIWLNAVDHYVVLQFGCFAQERSGLALDDGKLVQLLVFIN